MPERIHLRREKGWRKHGERGRRVTAGDVPQGWPEYCTEAFDA